MTAYLGKSIAGRTYTNPSNGRTLGVVMPNVPPVRVQGYRGKPGRPKHGLIRRISRGLPISMVFDAIRRPVVVLNQRNSNYVFLSRDACVVTSHDGYIITTYGSMDFDNGIRQILSDAGA